MNAGMKMLLIANREREKRDRRDEYAGVESRFRDRQGRERYDDGRYAPMNNMDMPEAYPYGRDDGATMRRPTTPYVLPVYRDDEAMSMNRIGFSLEPEAHDRAYRQDTSRRAVRDEARMTNNSFQIGHGSTAGSMKFDLGMAEAWASHMENEDGTKGPHWTMEQVKHVMAQKGVEHDPIEFWAVINAIYSDDVAVAQKHGVNKIDYYVDRAKSWLKDKDAVQDKAAAYYTYVVKHGSKGRE